MKNNKIFLCVFLISLFSQNEAHLNDVTNEADFNGVRSEDLDRFCELVKKVTGKESLSQEDVDKIVDTGLLNSYKKILDDDEKIFFFPKIFRKKPENLILANEIENLKELSNESKEDTWHEYYTEECVGGGDLARTFALALFVACPPLLPLSLGIAIESTRKKKVYHRDKIKGYESIVDTVYTRCNETNECDTVLLKLAACFDKNKERASKGLALAKDLTEEKKQYSTLIQENPSLPENLLNSSMSLSSWSRYNNNNIHIVSDHKTVQFVEDTTNGKSNCSILTYPHDKKISEDPNCIMYRQALRRCLQSNNKKRV